MAFHPISFEILPIYKTRQRSYTLHLCILLFCQPLKPTAHNLGRLEDLCLGQLGGRIHRKLDYPTHDQQKPRRNGTMSITLLAPQSRAVHRLAHRPEHKPDRILELDIVLVLLLEQTLRRAVVRADAGRLPARVVP